MDLEEVFKKGFLCYFAFYMAKLLFENFGWFTTIGYVFVFVMGLDKLDENPYRIFG